MSEKSAFSKSMLLRINKILSFILIFINTVTLGSTHFRLWISIRPTARGIQAMSGLDRRSLPELPGLFCVSFKTLFQHELFFNPLKIPWISRSSESEF